MNYDNRSVATVCNCIGLEHVALLDTDDRLTTDWAVEDIHETLITCCMMTTVEGHSSGSFETDDAFLWVDRDSLATEFEDGDLVPV